MTYTAIAGGGLFWPQQGRISNTFSNFGTLDATGEQFAMMGRIYIDGRPAAAKTLSTGTIQFRTGACTFANGSTTMDIGIQDVASGAGPIVQPDGTFDVSTTLTGGAGITTTAWNTATMSSGTKNITHGDLIAVVWNMTNRAGADSVTVSAGLVPINYFGLGCPTTNAFVSGAWQTSAAQAAGKLPNVVIVFDDGTIGWFDSTIPVSVGLTDEGFNDATNPDERGIMFQVPFDCKIDCLWAELGITNANSDFSIKFYSDPTGSPSALSTNVVLAEQMGLTSGATTSTLITIPLASEISLSANTDYAITVLGTGSSNLLIKGATLGDAAHRVAIPGGTTVAKVTRDGSAGAFSATTTVIYEMGVRISSISTGSAAVGTVIGS